MLHTTDLFCYKIWAIAKKKELFDYTYTGEFSVLKIYIYKTAIKFVHFTLPIMECYSAVLFALNIFSKQIHT